MNSIEYFEIILKLLLSCVLGGVIGAERESENKNAGFRTHMLVCVASALVMITSEFIFERYKGLVNIDPARLGAQVISGIGFLGAGAIINDKFRIKGLTTAASLWTVACIGLACGIGFYEGAIGTTLLSMLVLVFLKKLGRKFKNNFEYILLIRISQLTDQIGIISDILKKRNILIKKIITNRINDEYEIRLHFKFIKKPETGIIESIIEEAQCQASIQGVECKGRSYSFEPQDEIESERSGL